MPGVPDPAVGELAFYPHLQELGFQQIAHADVQLGDAQDPARRRRLELKRKFEQVFHR